MTTVSTGAGIGEPVPHTRPITDQDQLDWCAHLFEYRRLKALMDADEALGPTAASEVEQDCARALLAERHGGREAAMRNPTAAAEFKAIMEADNAACARQFREFVTPCDLAAVRLAVTPAPNLDAAILKIAIIKERELDSFGEMPGDPFDFVAADLERLKGCVA